MDENRPGAPRSPIAAALLNLTGLGLGYSYLGRWWRQGLHLVVTAGLVVIAFVTGAAALPWLWVAVTIGWLGWMTVDGFGQVNGRYELTLSPDVARADAGRAECAAFLAAADAAGRGGYVEAVRLYGDLRRAHPDGPLAPFVDAELRRTLEQWAGELRGAGEYDEAVRVYRDLLAEVGDGPEAAGVRAALAATYVEGVDALRAQLATLTGQPRVDAVRSGIDDLVAVQRDLADTPSAAGAAQALADLYAAANTQAATGLWCEALPVLDHVVTVTDPEAAGIVAAAAVDRPAALFGCGLQEYGAGRWTEAAVAFDRLVAEYPDHPQRAQARADAIAARAAAVQGAALPALPGPFTGDTPGSIPVTLLNDNPAEVRVFVVGPTAHELVLPGCPDCPASYATDAEACPPRDGRPSQRLTLPPGDYTIISQYPTTNPAVQTSSVQRGFEYSNCLYVGP